MSLWSQLDEELESQGAARLKKSRAKAALKTLSSIFGAGFVLDDKDVVLAEVVDVPGENIPWVVFGTWEDGSCDIIREGGIFPQDTMTGWVRGQSVRDYRRALDEEFKDADTDPGADGGAEAVPEGARGPLAVLPGGGVRGSERQPGRQARHHARRGEDRSDHGPAPRPTGRFAAAESVVPAGRGSRTDS